MSSKWNDPLQFQLSSFGNETVLHSPMLENGSVQGSKKNSLQDGSLQDDSVQDLEITVCKMTVCKRLWYSLQDDSL